MKNLRELVLTGQEEDSLNPFIETAVFLVNSVISSKDKFHYQNDLVLKVIPKEPTDIPIRLLTFNGQSPVLSGMAIRAKIPRFDNDGAFIYSRDHGKPARPYCEEEMAIQIELLSKDDITGDVRVLRTDRSKDYSYYTSK